MTVQDFPRWLVWRAWKWRAVSAPHRDRVLSETAAEADVVLSAAQWAEEDGR